MESIWIPCLSSSLLLDICPQGSTREVVGISTMPAPIRLYFDPVRVTSTPSSMFFLCSSLFTTTNYLASASRYDRPNLLNFYLYPQMMLQTCLSFPAPRRCQPPSSRPSCDGSRRHLPRSLPLMRFGSIWSNARARKWKLS